MLGLVEIFILTLFICIALLFYWNFKRFDFPLFLHTLLPHTPSLLRCLSITQNVNASRKQSMEAAVQEQSNVFESAHNSGETEEERKPVKRRKTRRFHSTETFRIVADPLPLTSNFLVLILNMLSNLNSILLILKHLIISLIKLILNVTEITT